MSYSGYPLEDMEYELVRVSRLIDDHNRNQGRGEEAITWSRLAKIGEELGEVIAAHIGQTAQNPRKGTTHTTEDVKKELIDVAATALYAYEHMDGHAGRSMHALHAYVMKRREVYQPRPEEG